jgi:hypothetical protein
MIAPLRHSWQPLNLEYQRTHNAWHFADQRVNTGMTGGLAGFRKAFFPAFGLMCATFHVWMAPVCTENSVRIDRPNRLTSAAMIALFCLFLTVLTSPFKSKSRLEAENAALRCQLLILRRKVRSRVYSCWRVSTISPCIGPTCQPQSPAADREPSVP